MLLVLSIDVWQIYTALVCFEYHHFCGWNVYQFSHVSLYWVGWGSLVFFLCFYYWMVPLIFRREHTALLHLLIPFSLLPFFLLIYFQGIQWTRNQDTRKLPPMILSQYLKFLFCQRVLTVFVEPDKVAWGENEFINVGCFK